MRRRAHLHGQAPLAVGGRTLPPSALGASAHRPGGGPDGLLQLQRTLGNRAVGAVVQRLPDSTSVKSQLGKTKRSWRIGHGSTKYKAVLNALDAYQNYITKTQVIGNSVAAQFEHMLNLLKPIEDAIASYQGRKGSKADYFINVLRPKVQLERSLIAQTMLSVKVNGIPRSLIGFTLSGLLLRNLGSTRLRELDESMVSGKDKGGTSEVTKFNVGGGTSYFKENKETLSHFGDERDEVLVDLKNRYGPEKGMEIFNGMQNESDIGVDLVGIDKDNARMANRDVAMSRLDQLLGAGVIAQAELAVRLMPNGGGKELGSLMKEAKGKSGGQIMQEDKLAQDTGEKGQMSTDTVNMEDPTLMRLMSRLQLIDLLAFQVDRNPKNYHILQDRNGNVVGITGIDNDFAFGTNTDVTGMRNQELPGISRYVDKELASRIMQVDLAVVRIIMADLLSPAEIEALAARFKKVQTELADKKTKLLEPNEWTQAVLKGLMDEDKSYLSDMLFQQDRKYRPNNLKALKQARGKA